MLHNDNFTVHDSIEAYFGHVIIDVWYMDAACRRLIGIITNSNVHGTNILFKLTI